VYLICIHLKIIFIGLNIQEVIEPKWGWKISPDCSGYAAWSMAFAAKGCLAAFERKAGCPFESTQLSFASKK